MDSAAETLLIIVSSVLTVFLIALLIAATYVVVILKEIRKITRRAENVVDSVGSAASAFERSASKISILKLLSNIVEHAAHGSKKRR